MEGNPYKEIIDTVNEQVHRGVLPLAITGVVLTAAPLTVSAGGVVLSAASGLLVSADLLPRTRKTKLSNPETAIDVEVTGAVSGKLTVEAEKLETEIKAEEMEGTLFPGDRVLLVTADQNIYTVVCKVVSAP